MRQAPPEDGVVHRVVGHQVQEAVDQAVIVFMRRGQPQFGAHAGHEFGRKECLERFQGGHGDGRVANQRLQRLAQAVQVPVHHRGLLPEGVAALVVAVVADVVGVEGVEELERPVVDGQPQDAHVVGVEHAMAKPHGLPLRHQGGGALAHGLQQCRVAVAVEAHAFEAFGIVAFDHVVGQLAQFVQLPARGEMLEMPEADEARRHARDHGGGLDGLAAHRLGRARDAQGPRGGDAQGVHGFAAQKLADARTQHGAAVAHA